MKRIKSMRMRKVSQKIRLMKMCLMMSNQTMPKVEDVAARLTLDRLRQEFVISSYQSGLRRKVIKSKQFVITLILRDLSLV